MADEGYSDLILKKVTLSSASPGFSGESDLTLALVEIDSEGYGWSGESDLTLSTITIDSGGTNYTGTSELTLLPLIINSEGNMTTGYSTITLKKSTLSSSGYTAGYGISAFKLPIVSLSSAGGVIGTGNSALILPIVELSSSSDTGTSYLCLVLNNENSLTEWGFSFDSMVEFDGETYGANSTGLYKLGGDTDNGTEIESIIQLGLDDSGTSLLKQILGYYVGLRSDGAMNIQLIADDETDLQIHNIRTTSDTIKPRKVAVRGPRGRWIGAKIYNTNGCYFKIVSMGVLAEILQQREQNAIPL